MPHGITVRLVQIEDHVSVSDALPVTRSRAFVLLTSAVAA